MSRDYLLLEDILEIHDEQISHYGGANGIRDVAGVESALGRAQSGYYQDIIGEAAALWESLSQNHPFVDGNKRTAFSATYRFLALNDVLITADADADADAAWQFLSHAYETANMNFANLEEWLSKNTESR